MGKFSPFLYSIGAVSACGVLYALLKSIDREAQSRTVLPPTAETSRKQSTASQPSSPAASKEETINWKELRLELESLERRLDDAAFVRKQQEEALAAAASATHVSITKSVPTGKKAETLISYRYGDEDL